MQERTTASQAINSAPQVWVDGDSAKVHDPWKMYLGSRYCSVVWWDQSCKVFFLRKNGCFNHWSFSRFGTLRRWQGRLRGYSCQLEWMVVMWGFCSSRSCCFQKMQFFLPRLVLSFWQDRLGRPCSDSALLYYDKLCCIYAWTFHVHGCNC